MLKKRSYLLIILFLIITTGISLLVLQGQTSKETAKLKPSPTKSKEARSDIRDTFPVVEYSSKSLLKSEKRKGENTTKSVIMGRHKSQRHFGSWRIENTLVTRLGKAGTRLQRIETDENGNQFKYRAKVKDDKGNQIGRWARDVFLSRNQ